MRPMHIEPGRAHDSVSSIALSHSGMSTAMSDPWSNSDGRRSYQCVSLNTQRPAAGVYAIRAPSSTRGYRAAMPRPARMGMLGFFEVRTIARAHWLSCTHRSAQGTLLVCGPLAVYHHPPPHPVSLCTDTFQVRRSVRDSRATRLRAIRV